MLPQVAEEGLTRRRVGECGPGQGACEWACWVEGAVWEFAEDVERGAGQRRRIASLRPVLRRGGCGQELSQEGERGGGGALGRPRVEDVEEDWSGGGVDVPRHESSAQGRALVGGQWAPRGPAAFLLTAEGEQVRGGRSHRGPVMRHQGLAVALHQRLETLWSWCRGGGGGGSGSGRPGWCGDRGRVARCGPAKHAGQATEVAVLGVPGNGVLGLLQHGPQHAAAGGRRGRGGHAAERGGDGGNGGARTRSAC